MAFEMRASIAPEVVAPTLMTRASIWMCGIRSCAGCHGWGAEGSPLGMVMWLV